MKMRTINYKFILLVTSVIAIASCKKFIEVKAPANTTNTEIVFNSNETAISEITGIYATMSKGYPNGYMEMSLLPELSADNLRLFAARGRCLPFYKNSLSPLYSETSPYFWNGSYQLLYSANAAIEGLNNSTKLNPVVKQQLLGEVYFIRGFLYYYLVNLFGDVPLVLTTDYTVTEKISRSPITKVYDQIISDLKIAEDKLTENYLDGTLLHTSLERVRPNKAVASALLARVFLFKGDYLNSEIYATKVIGNSAYSIIELDQVFLKNSRETIWALQPVVNGQNTKEGLYYTLPPSGPNDFSQPVSLSPDLINSFDGTDLRKNIWMKTITVGNIEYTYPTKYKAGTFPISSPPIAATEYSIVMRIAEQYLIRSEARAQQNNISGAQDDLKKIRERAGLNGSIPNDKDLLLSFILKERRLELFTEWGHRWLDLKRTGKVNEVMSVVTPTKEGGVWKPEYQYYPIPQTERNINPNLSQNSGYPN